jgi:hypothetical protein
MDLDKKYIVKYVIDYNIDVIFKIFYNYEDYVTLNYLKEKGWSFGKLADQTKGYFGFLNGDDIEHTNEDAKRKISILSINEHFQLVGREATVKLLVEKDEISQVCYYQKITIFPSNNTNQVVFMHKLYDLKILNPNTTITLESEKALIEEKVDTFKAFVEYLCSKEKMVYQNESAIINTSKEKLTALCRDLISLQKIAPLLCDKIKPIYDSDEKDSDKDEDICKNKKLPTQYKLIWNDGRQSILKYYVKSKDEARIEDAFNEVAFITVDPDETKPKQIIYFMIWEIDKRCLLKFCHQFEERIRELSYQFFYDIKRAILLQIKEHFE